MEGPFSVENVFERYADMVYRLAYARVKNRYDADDILQEVFLRYLRSGKPVESEAHAKALLITITINCSKKLLTGSWFRKTEPLRDDLEGTPEDRETLDAVLRLPLAYRTVVHLHYYDGYSVEEIASLLSLKPATVKSRLFRAREKLRKELKGVVF